MSKFLTIKIIASFVITKLNAKWKRVVRKKEEEKEFVFGIKTTISKEIYFVIYFHDDMF